MAMCFNFWRSAERVIFRSDSADTTTTSELVSSGSMFLTSLACARFSMVALSAEMNTSSGAPSSIWRASTFDPAKTGTALPPLVFCHAAATSVTASARLAAAATRISSALAKSDPNSRKRTMRDLMVRHDARVARANPARVMPNIQSVRK